MKRDCTLLAEAVCTFSQFFITQRFPFFSSTPGSRVFGEILAGDSRAGAADGELRLRGLLIRTIADNPTIPRIE